MKASVDTFLSIDSGTSKSILNSLKDQICLIDTTGVICFVNEEWNRFALSNGNALSSCGIGTDYLQQCEKEPIVHQGLQAILAGDADCFNFEYPCHSPSTKRWFLMQATPLQTNHEFIEGVVIRHVDITKQKLLELQLKDYAEKDALTSLFNRRYFEEQLTKEVNLALKRNTCLSLLYIDTDNFKEINDAYGHLAGDQVLKELALQIAAVSRSSDTAARIGGDEFAILMPNTNKAELELIANRVRQEIRHLKILEQGQPIDVTVSIGGKSFDDGSRLNSMAKWVDKALYSAKAKGKNQVVIV
ncbi:sensor domain-containing diguanylate cyclase [Planomicrobium sp. CPCC 101079]|uniref:sensor domain-containing diguanylate cyclase n=1 Tax=Planomicrobium sp. CPCC 101079 TaxID=2599618 RepID=UPI0011B36782|nr:sensor domain-containing diguanylate cyclase [Planomicrobium sp. CPCC 101079]TWT00122.1 sensor domain-containing diguanylate cyclase [Planomicrobium sp. CPCC 101079]